jgi:hypothetical protein
MTDRPIPFSPPMVRALLARRKMQTRRILNPQPDVARLSPPFRPEAREGHRWVWMNRVDFPSYAFASDDFRVPYAVGDRLWVKEALTKFQTFGGQWATCHYPADDTPVAGRPLSPAWTPDGRAKWLWPKSDKLSSRFCPRWASRLMLTVTDVRVQRVQDISEKDAYEEGISEISVISTDAGNVPPIEKYAHLWDSLHGRGAWDANPWVAVITFATRRQNIDEAPWWAP